MRIAPTPRPAAASPLPRAKTLRVTRGEAGSVSGFALTHGCHEPGSGLWFYPALSALRRTRDSRFRSLREHEPGSGLWFYPALSALRRTRDSRFRSLREHEPSSGLWFYPALSALRRTRDSRFRSLREHEPSSGLFFSPSPSLVIPDICKRKFRDDKTSHNQADIKNTETRKITGLEA